MHIANMRIFVTCSGMLNRIYRIDLFKIQVINLIKNKLLNFINRVYADFSPS